MKRPARALGALFAAVAVTAGSGCRSSAPPAVDPGLVRLALPELQRPLEGDPAALYRLRVPNAANLRLALLVAGDAGRMTISERFGSALTLTAWKGEEAPDLLDFREGCMVRGADLTRILGVAVMPMPQAVRFLVGRLPAAGSDRVAVRPDGLIEITGDRWSAVAEVRPEPWRVVMIREVADGNRGWTVTITDHAAAVPAALTIRKPGEGWAELELVRLEWDEANQLPPRPQLPPCAGQRSSTGDRGPSSPNVHRKADERLISRTAISNFGPFSAAACAPRPRAVGSTCVLHGEIEAALREAGRWK